MLNKKNKMALLSVLVTLAVVGVCMFGVSRAPFIAQPYKTAIYWVAGVCTALWLLSITGVIGNINNIQVPHV